MTIVLKRSWRLQVDVPFKQLQFPSGSESKSKLPLVRSAKALAHWRKGLPSVLHFHLAKDAAAVLLTTVCTPTLFGLLMLSRT